MHARTRIDLLVSFSSALYLPSDLPFALQCVLTPAAPYMSKTNEEIAEETDRQVGAAAAHWGKLIVDRGR
jgi:hypothetical protein